MSPAVRQILRQMEAAGECASTALAQLHLGQEQVAQQFLDEALHLLGGAHQIAAKSPVLASIEYPEQHLGVVLDALNLAISTLTEAQLLTYVPDLRLLQMHVMLAQRAADRKPDVPSVKQPPTLIDARRENELLRARKRELEQGIDMALRQDLPEAVRHLLRGVRFPQATVSV